MDYTKRLKHHYQPAKGWMNDPNGLVYFKGYYHLFYQHSPNFECPGKEAMYWGHARTENFVDFEELPLALSPDMEYDKNGCWSGTAIVKDDTLYLFYASIKLDENGDMLQKVSVAYSNDGITFIKAQENPVIDKHPTETGNDFRDPAVVNINGEYYLTVAAGNRETNKGFLVLYKSEDLIKWDYVDFLKTWDNCVYTECPSFLNNDKETMVSVSVCPTLSEHYFSIMFGKFDGKHFIEEASASVDKGPDQYAGQAFKDDKGRFLLISWIPGWRYINFAEKSIGCLSVPREIKCENGKITAYPIEEVRHLLKCEDDYLIRTDDGFTVKREHNGGNQHISGTFDTIEMIRDEYVLEVYVNHGEEIYTFIL